MKWILAICIYFVIHAVLIESYSENNRAKDSQHFVQCSGDSYSAWRAFVEDERQALRTSSDSASSNNTKPLSESNPANDRRKPYHNLDALYLQQQQLQQQSQNTAPLDHQHQQHTSQASLSSNNVPPAPISHASPPISAPPSSFQSIYELGLEKWLDDHKGSNHTTASPKRVLLVSTGLVHEELFMRSLAQELCSRGHHVIVALPHAHENDMLLRRAYSCAFQIAFLGPCCGRRLESMLKEAYHADSDMDNFRSVHHFTQSLFISVGRSMQHGLHELIQLLTKHSKNALKRDVDIIVADIFLFTASDVAQRHSLPLIYVNPSGVLVPAPLGHIINDYDYISMTCSSSLIGQSATSYPCPSTSIDDTCHAREINACSLSSGSYFWNQFTNLLLYLGSWFFGLVPFEAVQKIRWLYGVDPLPSVSHMLSASMVIHNTMPGLLASLPSKMPANHMFSGPLLPRYVPALAADEIRWLEIHPKIVLVWLDSLFIQNHEIRALLVSLLLAREQLGIDIVWAVQGRIGTQVFEDPKGIFHIDDLKLSHVLAQKSMVAAFVPCHGEFVQTVIYFGVPVVCISSSPLGREIGHQVQVSGVGLHLPRSVFRNLRGTTRVYTALLEVLQIPSFKLEAGRMSAALHETGGSASVADHIEFVADHGGIRWFNENETTDSQFWSQAQIWPGHMRGAILAGYDVLLLFASLCVLSMYIAKYFTVRMVEAWITMMVILRSLVQSAMKKQSSGSHLDVKKEN